MASNKPEVIWKGDEVMIKLHNTAIQNLQFASVFLKGAIKVKLTGNRSGRVYRVPGTKVFYTASAPGEPPASRLGDLKGAISHRVNKNKLEAFVGPRLLGSDPDKQYPKWLELGTPKGQMSPRPYMAPSFQENKAAIVQIMKDGWNE